MNMAVHFDSLPSISQDARAWAEAQGLVSPADLRFAFTSSDEAARLGGAEVAAAWNFLVELPTHKLVGSTWSLLVRARKHVAEPTAAIERTVPCKPFQLWRGLGAKAKQFKPSLQADFSSRRAVALQAVNLAMTWRHEGSLWSELQSAPKTLHSAIRERWISRLARFNAGSI